MTKANQGFLFELFHSENKPVPEETKKPRSVPPKIAFTDLDLIHPNPAEPRKTSNEAGLRELADSIQEYGLLNPILVRPETGWEVHHLSGLTATQSVPAAVSSFFSMRQN